MKTKKIYNEIHDVLTTIELSPIGETNNLVVGDITPHEQKVKYISKQIQINADGDLRSICLNRDFILDLAEQIRQIEGEVVDSEYSYQDMIW